METFAQLQDQVAVVTGSSSGIGRAIALELARAGAHVFIHCRKSRPQAEQVAEEVRSLGRDSEVFAADLSDPSATLQFFEAAWNWREGVQVWVNNAGVDLLTGKQAKLGYLEKLRLLMDVDIRATVELTQAAGERMKQTGTGVILNIGWDQADRGMEGASGELFATSKNAVMGFSRSAAVSLAPEVRVNCIAPGWIRTAWGETASDSWQERVMRETPLKRWGTPEDIAKVARFLASPDASYLTGQVINVNGGAIR